MLECLLVSGFELRYDSRMIFFKNYFFPTTENIDVISLHAEVQFALRDSTLKGGLFTVTIPDNGASVVVMEPLPEVIENLKAEKQIQVTSTTLPFQDGKLLLAPKRNLYVIDFSNGKKRREVYFHLMGDAPEPPKGKTPARR